MIQLFHAKMTVNLPHDMPAATADDLKLRERDMALRLQAEGTWWHLRRIVGQYANSGIFRVPKPKPVTSTPRRGRNT
jgi:muconolactone D-isomerase